MPGIVSQYSDRLGRIYGSNTLEANWYEERLQLAAGVLKPAETVIVLRPFESDLAAYQKSISGNIAVCSRTNRHPFMFQSRMVSDGMNERISMNETFYKPLHERPPNPAAGKITAHDAMVMRFAQTDEPKTRQSKDRMSNIEHEVRPLPDSEAKVRKHFVTPSTLHHIHTERPSTHSALRGFGAVVPRHPSGHSDRLFSTTTGEALSTGRAPASLQPHQTPPSSTMIGQRANFSSGGYEKTATNHTVFTFGFAKEANAQLPGLGTREHFGKTSLIKAFQIANNAPPPPALVKA